MEMKSAYPDMTILLSAAKVRQKSETAKDLAKKARPLNSKMANADTLEGAGVNSGNALDVAKLQNNSEITKLSSKKELPPVLPLGTNRRGISQGSSWCCTPVWLVFNGRTGMRGTAPSGSVQLQDYCVRPEKIGEPFFQSLSAFASDPRRRANAPVNTYSALSSRWRGLSVSDVRTCPTPYALDALAQPSNRILAPSYREMELLSKQLPCQVIAFIGYRCPANSEYLGEHINANSDI